MAQKQEPVEGSVITFSESYFAQWTPPGSKGKASRLLPQGCELTVRSDGTAPIGWTTRSVGLSLAREVVRTGKASITFMPQVEAVPLDEPKEEE